MSELDTVRKMYAAYARGNYEAILPYLAESVEWEYGLDSTELPWLRHRRGRDEVVEFFRALDALVIHRFIPKTLLQAGQVVVALFDFEATVKATGTRIIEEDDVHIWHFDAEGKVFRFRHRVDTHQQLMAFHLADPNALYGTTR